MKETLHTWVDFLLNNFFLLFIFLTSNFENLKIFPFSILPSVQLAIHRKTDFSATDNLFRSSLHSMFFQRSYRKKKSLWENVAECFSLSQTNAFEGFSSFPFLYVALNIFQPTTCWSFDEHWIYEKLSPILFWWGFISI